MFRSAALATLCILMPCLATIASASPPSDPPTAVVTANPPPASSADRDSVPYADRVSNIVTRLRADDLSGYRTKVVPFKTKQEAFEYSRQASTNSSSRKPIASNIEATQTWFQSDPQKPDNSVVIFIYVAQDFLQSPLSGIIFNLSARGGKHCPTLPQDGKYFAVVPDTTISKGKEAVLVAKFPSSKITTSPNMKCGTVVEAW